jgi:glycosyltransferase involved in cell wall biosynthesis
MSRPRVLFVGRTRYRLPLEAGLARKWDAVSERLDLRVLATGEGEGDPRFLLGRASTTAFYSTLPLRVAATLRRFDADAIVAQSPYEAAAALVGRRLAGSGAGLVLEVHGDWRTATRLYGSPLRRLAEPVSHAAARLALRRSDAVRTVSPFTTELVRALGVEPAATFTTYFDLAAFTAQPPMPLPQRASALFVGVLERYKDVGTLASAWRRVAAELPDVTLEVIGSGREQNVVEALLRDVPDRVAWRRRVPPEEVAMALDGSTVLLLPSRSEGLPRVAMEAFARHRPVVGARAGGIPDIVDDGISGLLVPAGDAVALAGAATRVLRDGALAERLAAGAAAAAGRWLQPPEVYATRLAELVEKLRA